MLCSQSMIAKGDNLLDFWQNNTESIEFFIAFSDKFFGIILREDLCGGLMCGVNKFIKILSLFKFQDTAGFVIKII